MQAIPERTVRLSLYKGLQIRLQQLFPSPKCAFGHGLIFIARKLLEQREKSLLTAIAHGDSYIPAQPGAFCPTDWRSAKYLAEFFRAHFSQPLECWIYQLRTRLQFWCSGYGSPPIPGTHVLADVAAK